MTRPLCRSYPPIAAAQRRIAPRGIKALREKTLWFLGMNTKHFRHFRRLKTCWLDAGGLKTQDYNPADGC